MGNSMAWTIDAHLGGTDDDRSGAQRAATRPDCPGCGHPDEHGDDFCHECGHAFEHFGHGDAGIDHEELGLPCPMCHSGELASLDHGRTQCDSCGYMVRDEGM